MSANGWATVVAFVAARVMWLPDDVNASEWTLGSEVPRLDELHVFLNRDTPPQAA